MEHDHSLSELYTLGKAVESQVTSSSQIDIVFVVSVGGA